MCQRATLHLPLYASGEADRLSTGRGVFDPRQGRCEIEQSGVLAGPISRRSSVRVRLSLRNGLKLKATGLPCKQTRGGAIPPGSTWCSFYTSAKKSYAHLVHMLVFLIDDDFLFGQLVFPVFEKRGHRLFWKRSVGGTLTEIRARGPDLILLDVHLPEVPGPRAVGFIRQVSSSPIWLISGIPSEDLEIQAGICGADDFWSKMDGLDQLMYKISMGLRLR